MYRKPFARLASFFSSWSFNQSFFHFGLFDFPVCSAFAMCSQIYRGTVFTELSVNTVFFGMTLFHAERVGLTVERQWKLLKSSWCAQLQFWASHTLHQCSSPNIFWCNHSFFCLFRRLFQPYAWHAGPNNKNTQNIKGFDFHTSSAITMIIVSLEYAFLYCYFGTRTTTAATSIADISYATAWYGYSPEIRKCLLLIICRAQQPIYFTGFKLIQCSLETLAKATQHFIHFTCDAKLCHSHCNRFECFLLFLSFVFSLSIFYSLATRPGHTLWCFELYSNAEKVLVLQYLLLRGIEWLYAISAHDRIHSATVKRFWVSTVECNLSRIKWIHLICIQFREWNRSFSVFFG